MSIHSVHLIQLDRSEHGGRWFVPSRSRPGYFLLVSYDVGEKQLRCSCPWGQKAEHMEDPSACRHLKAVEQFARPLKETV